jgi:hypothetical protein
VANILTKIQCNGDDKGIKKMDFRIYLKENKPLVINPSSYEI